MHESTQLRTALFLPGKTRELARYDESEDVSSIHPFGVARGRPVIENAIPWFRDWDRTTDQNPLFVPIRVTNLGDLLIRKRAVCPFDREVRRIITGWPDISTNDARRAAKISTYFLLAE